MSPLQQLFVFCMHKHALSGKPQVEDSTAKGIPSKAPLQFNAALALSALVNSTNAIRVGWW